MRLKLVLADSDDAYAESLIGYLTEKHPYQFQINYFTGSQYLNNYLLKNSEAVDILLVDEKLYDEVKYSNIISMPIIIMLITNNDKNYSENRNNTIYKYCPGEKLVQDILNTYKKDRHVSINALQDEVCTCQVISIYSPAGGTGKTTVAVNMASQYASGNKNVFYLNLESIYSNTLTGNVSNDYQSDNGQIQDNLSKILFTIKQGEDNFGDKIQKAICKDKCSGISYFNPPDSFLELDEVSASDVNLLIEEIKLTGIYNTIIIDLSNAYNHNNISAMEASNRLIFISTPDIISINKMETFLKEITFHGKKKNIDFIGKSILIVNKWQPQEGCLNIPESIFGKKIDIKIPIEEKLNKTAIISQNTDYEEANSFITEIRRLITEGNEYK